MDTKYHKLYVASDLWDDICEHAYEFPGLSPKQFVLSAVREKLYGIKPTKTAASRPGKIKKTKTKQQILLLLCKYTGNEDDYFEWTDDPEVQRTWKLFCTKMGREKDYAKCLIAEAEVQAIKEQEDAPCKHMAEDLYHSWNAWNEAKDEELLNNERIQGADPK